MCSFARPTEILRCFQGASKPYFLEAAWPKTMQKSPVLLVSAVGIELTTP
jgi:hypothetical protein